MSTAARRASRICRACGACCAAFQVSFYWAEAEARGVPEAMVVPVGRLRLAMAGTERPAPRCDALLGDVGAGTACTIYERRPDPCREFAPAWQDGAANPACDRARARHGLPPLEPRDWDAPEPEAPEPEIPQVA